MTATSLQPVNIEVLTAFAVGTTLYAKMCLAIAEAAEVDEVVTYRDKAIALAEYARRAKNIEAERAAQNVRLVAERRAGELTPTYDRDPSSKGGDQKSASRRGTPIQPSPFVQMLEATKLTRREVSRFEKIAAIPEPKFQAALAAPIPPTTRPPTPPKPAAMKSPSRRRGPGTCGWIA
jgi:hypothetical protein